MWVTKGLVKTFRLKLVQINQEFWSWFRITISSQDFEVWEWDRAKPERRIYWAHYYVGFYSPNSRKLSKYRTRVPRAPWISYLKTPLVQNLGQNPQSISTDLSHDAYALALNQILGQSHRFIYDGALPLFSWEIYVKFLQLTRLLHLDQYFIVLVVSCLLLY